MIKNIITALPKLALQFRIYEPLAPAFGTFSSLYGFGYTFLLDVFFTQSSSYSTTLHKWTMTQKEYFDAHNIGPKELPTEVGNVKKLLNPIYQNEPTEAIDEQYKAISDALKGLKKKYNKGNDDYIFRRIQGEIDAVEHDKAILKALVDVQTGIDAATATNSNYKGLAAAALTLTQQDNTLKKYAGHMQEIAQNTAPFHDKDDKDQKALKAKFSKTVSDLIATKKRAIESRLNSIHSTSIYTDRWEFQDILNYLRLPAVGLGFFKFYYYDWQKLIAMGLKLPIINLWVTNIDLNILPAFALRYWAISVMSRIFFGKDYNFHKLAGKGLSDFVKILSFTSSYIKFYSITAINYTKLATLSKGALPEAVKFSLTVKELAILSIQTALLASTMLVPMSTSIEALLSFNPIVAQTSFILSGIALLLENADYYLQGAISNMRDAVSGLAQASIVGIGIFAAAPQLVQGNIPAVVMIGIGTMLGVTGFNHLISILEQKWSKFDSSMIFSNFGLSSAAFGIPMVLSMYGGAPVTGLTIGAVGVMITTLLEKAQNKENDGNARGSDPS